RPLLDDGRLWRVQLDTYEREVERYGGPEGILLAERMFHIDSEAVLAVVAMLAGDAGADARWRLALRGIDMLLADLRLGVDARRTLMRRVRDAFAKEFQADTALKHQLGVKYRQGRKGLEALLDPTRDAEGVLAPGLEVLRRRSERLAPVAAELEACERAGRLDLPLGDLASSHIHMHANRLLRSDHRRQELVLYNFLARLYEPQSARGRHR